MINWQTPYQRNKAGPFNLHIQRSFQTMPFLPNQRHQCQIQPPPGCKKPTAPASITTQMTQMTPEASSSPADVVDNFNISTVLNTLFGGESAANNAPQPLNFSNNILMGATVSSRLKQKNLWEYQFLPRLLLPNQQDDNFSVSVERGAINFQQGTLYIRKWPCRKLKKWRRRFCHLVAKSVCLLSPIIRNGSRLAKCTSVC